MATALASSKGVQALSHTRSPRAFSSGPLPACSSRRCVVVRAAEPATSTSSPPAEQQTGLKLDWPTDTETLRDLFSVSGPLAERLNGRLAMLGFTGLATSELSSGTPAAEQFGGDVAGILLLALAISFASVAPKFASGNSLKALTDSAQREKMSGSGGLSEVQSFFDANLEIWSGRMAMVGIVGLLVTEAVTGRLVF